jgi:carbon storage regulator
MLILARKIGEAIKIADEITITVMEIKGGQVKIGVDAPHHITIHRNEVYERILEENLKAARETPLDLSTLAAAFKTRS